MPQPFRAAVAAMHVAHDKTANLERFRQLIAEAAGAGARLLVLPEAALQGFLFHVDVHFDAREAAYHWENAEPVPGPSTDLVAEWAAEHELVVVFGMMERVEHPAVPVLHNSAVVVGPQGLIGAYRKVHRPSEEELTYRTGNDWPVFETPVGRVGALICYDQCFPEAARELTLRGAHVLAIPNAWAQVDPASDDRYDFFGRARAAENCRWVLQANQVGPSDRGDHVYMGHSRIVDPTGQVVARVAPGDEGLALADITPTTFDPTRARAGWLLQQRRPDTYTAIGDAGAY
jgi:predicted amidohydrolase